MFSHRDCRQRGLKLELDISTINGLVAEKCSCHVSCNLLPSNKDVDAFAEKSTKNVFL